MEVGKTPDKQTKDPDLITIGVMLAIMMIERMKHSRNHAMSVTHHYNEKDTYQWKKAYKDVIPPTSTSFLHQKIPAQSKTYTCEIPLATPWPLVHSKDQSNRFE